MLGTIIRHVSSAIAAGLAMWFVDLGVDLGPEFQTTTTLILYAIVEKLLKRFDILDEEGSAVRSLVGKG